MKKITNLLLIASLTFIFSCESDEVTPETIYKLVKIESFDSDDIIERTTAIEYNNGFISKVIEISSNGTDITNYGYLNGKVTSQDYNNGYSTKFIYTGELITSTLGIDADGVETGFGTTYTYNSNEQVISKVEFGPGFPDTTTTYTYDNNDNVISNGSTYDSKKNPFRLVFHPEELQKMESIGQNNLISDSSNLTYTYEYNNKDYPTKMYEYYNGSLMKYTIYTYNDI
ncbi:MAG: hypothetical protein L3J14_06505 [Flavobacteriaceae bacterium]|nr:hypothetical protein [Flavobacteriaceae bacterium]